jgi:hypothetical protein
MTHATLCRPSSSGVIEDRDVWASPFIVTLDAEKDEDDFWEEDADDDDDLFQEDEDELFEDDDSDLEDDEILDDEEDDDF